MKKLLFVTILLISQFALSQKNFWQQHVDYKMVIDVDVEKHTYIGTQRLVFTNNSPDKLDRVFYHLYFKFTGYQQGGGTYDLAHLPGGTYDLALLL